MRIFAVGVFVIGVFATGACKQQTSSSVKASPAKSGNEYSQKQDCTCEVTSAVYRVYLDTSCDGDLIDLDVGENHRYSIPASDGQCTDSDIRSVTVYKKDRGYCSANTYVGVKNCRWK